MSRSLGIIKWPPLYINFKSAIESCMPAPEKDQKNIFLMYLHHVQHSVDSLEEVQLLQTEMSASESETDSIMTDKESPENKSETDIPLRWGQMIKTQNAKRMQYESGDEIGKIVETNESEETVNTEPSITRVIRGELGSTLGSATEPICATETMSAAKQNACPEILSGKTPSIIVPQTS